MDKSKTVAFVGHRLLNTDIGALNRRLDEAVGRYHERGYIFFMADLTPQFGLLAAEAIIRRKAITPKLRFVAAVPFPRQDKYYSEDYRGRYGNVRLYADHEQPISRHYHHGCFHRCFDFMVHSASRLVVWYDDRPCGGTFHAVSEAICKGVPVHNLAQRERFRYRIADGGVNIVGAGSTGGGNRSPDGDPAGEPVAHISYDRDVIFHDTKLSLTARAQIERFARWDNVCDPAQPGRMALQTIRP